MTLKCRYSVEIWVLTISLHKNVHKVCAESICRECRFLPVDDNKANPFSTSRLLNFILQINCLLGAVITRVRFRFELFKIRCHDLEKNLGSSSVAFPTV